MQISSPNYLPRSTPDFSIPRQPKFRLMFIQTPAPKPQLAEPEPERPFLRRLLANLMAYTFSRDSRNSFHYNLFYDHSTSFPIQFYGNLYENTNIIMCPLLACSNLTATTATPPRIDNTHGPIDILFSSPKSP